MGLIVDLFAGGGGASEGIKIALGLNPDVAINHDRIAIAMHEANHPGTIHIRRDIWQVSPMMVTLGRPVNLLWASPDCKHFSKAKGSAPRRDVDIRSLAWTVEKWARAVGPRVIILENVEEFKDWGPLDNEGHVIKERRGETFNHFCQCLRRLGYSVETRLLRACDYGAPTIRRRLFVIARCDGRPIVWPEPTHGPGRIPYRTAAEIIDWSIPCPSIFERKKPLAENTLRRIAEGIRRYVLEAADPFIVPITHQGSVRVNSINDPLRTITTAHRGEMALVTPTLIQTGYGERVGQRPRVPGLNKPLGTIVASGGKHALIVPHIQRQFGQGVGSDAREPVGTITAGGMGKTALVSAFIAKHYGGMVGTSIENPLPTTTTRGTQNQVVTSNLVKLYGTCKDGQAVTEPMPTITSGGQHIGEVRAFLMKYYGNRQECKITDPIHTVTTKDRFGLVTVMVAGETYVITDIGMRMLSPRELFRAQGFADSYRIDIEVDGKPITKTAQVRCCGNSVCPPIAAALVRANVDWEPGPDPASDLGEFQMELAAA